MNPDFFTTPDVKRALGYGACAAGLRTGSIVLSKQVPVMANLNPALGVAGTFLSQFLTVAAITSGAMCTLYTTRAVTQDGRERREK